MATFLVNMFNHSDVGQRSLEDVVGIFGHQLRALGHRCVWENHNKNFYVGEGHDVINVVVEGFHKQHAPIIKAARDRGCKFLMLATEEPTEKGFNHGTQEEMVKRQRDFVEVAPMFDAILHLVPGEKITAWFSQFAPSAYLELGYAPTLVRTQKIEPDWDFGFYGSLTNRRLKILRKLANRIGTEKAVKIVADFKTQTERDETMMRCKVLVQIRKFDAMGLVSSSRCNTALCLGRPIVAEPHLLAKPWDEVVRFSNTLEGFFNTAVLVRSMWKGIHADQFAKFKEKFTPQICVGEPLERIGILQPVRKVA